MGIGIVGVGEYIPRTIVSNGTEFSEKIGVACRHIASKSETASQMSAWAIQEALGAIDPTEVGIVVGCTYAADNVFPAMACKVQDLVGMTNAGAFDILANCTAFQIGVGIVSDRMKCDDSIKYGVVVGTAVQSRFVNQESDLASYFGDGSGAAVLGRVPDGYGVLSTDIMGNTSVHDSVKLPWGADNYEMDGIEVWKQVVQYQPRVIRRALEKAGMVLDDVDFFIFHQANPRLIEYLMGKIKRPMRDTWVTADVLGNTAEASLPITLYRAVMANKIKRGDVVVISGVGAGFIFGATVMKWY